jgi:hypothetical protein
MLYYLRPTLWTALWERKTPSIERKRIAIFLIDLPGLASPFFLTSWQMTSGDVIVPDQPAMRGGKVMGVGLSRKHTLLNEMKPNLWCAYP